MRWVCALVLALLMSASVTADPITVEPLPGLEQAVSNNAVTLVEDSVMLVYQDRFIYLVSGRHDLVGGMQGRQTVVRDVYRFRIDP